jgi:flagellar protein FliO/FliZ
VASLLLFPSVALAANGEGTPLNIGNGARQGAEQVGGGSSIVRTIVGLAVVIGVIFGIHWVLKQVKGAREERTLGVSLATLATLPLGPNRSLHLVRTGSEVVLVGVGEAGVTPIRTYSEEEAQRLGLLVDPVAAAEVLAEEDGELPMRNLAVDPFTGAARGGPARPAGGFKRVLEDLKKRTEIR